MMDWNQFGDNILTKCFLTCFFVLHPDDVCDGAELGEELPHVFFLNLFLKGWDILLG